MGDVETAEPVILVCGADGPAGPSAITALLGVGARVLAGGSDHGVLAALARDGVLPLTLRSADPKTVGIALAIAEDRFGRLDEVLVLDGLGTETEGPAGVAARLDALVGWTAGLTVDPLDPPVLLRVAVAPAGAGGDASRPWGDVADAAVCAWVASQQDPLAELGLSAQILRVRASASARDWARRLAEGEVEGRLRGLARRLRGVGRGRRAP